MNDIKTVINSVCYVKYLDDPIVRKLVLLLIITTIKR